MAQLQVSFPATDSTELPFRLFVLHQVLAFVCHAKGYSFRFPKLIEHFFWGGSSTTRTTSLYLKPRGLQLRSVATAQLTPVQALDGGASGRRRREGLVLKKTMKSPDLFRKFNVQCGP